MATVWIKINLYISYWVPRNNIFIVSNSLQLHGLYSPWNSTGQNTGVGTLSLLQGILPIQGSNQVSTMVGRFFPSWATREALSIDSNN